MLNKNHILLFIYLLFLPQISVSYPISIDGDPSDWGNIGITDGYEFLPSYLDIISTHHFLAFMHTSDDNYYGIIRFYGISLGDSSDIEIEFFWDYNASGDVQGKDGDLTDDWEDFYPDYIFTVSGKNKQITNEEYKYWDGLAWVTSNTGQDITEIEAATNGNYFEFRIPLESLGDTLTSETFWAGWSYKVSQDTIFDISRMKGDVIKDTSTSIKYSTPKLYLVGFCDGANLCDLVIYDSKGALVIEYSNVSSSKTVNLGSNGFVPGIYFARVVNGKDSYIRKFIVLE